MKFSGVVLSLVLFSAACIPSASAQPLNEWTWVAGSNSAGEAAVYGIKGVPAAANHPGNGREAMMWSDQQDGLWFYGGLSPATTGAGANLSDLWKYDIRTGLWIWMHGPGGVTGRSPVYGTRGVPAPGNSPGARSSAATWRDAEGKFWLFGGSGPDSTGSNGLLSDLWRYDPATNQWTWMYGSDRNRDFGVYGTRGVPADANHPGARTDAVSWTDPDGRLWLFGGNGLDASGTLGRLNDLWRFDPKTGLWAYMHGSQGYGPTGVYGSIGIPAAANTPGARQKATGWSPGDGYLWLFGGIGLGRSTDQGRFNDLWRYNLTTGEWTWMGGSGFPNEPANYGTRGVAAVTNIPGGRYYAEGGVDPKGRLLLFGGLGFTTPSVSGRLNDLWSYDPAINQWTWVHGSDQIDRNGTYGQNGLGAPGNTPGARYSESVWTDSQKRLWIRGGFGFPASGAIAQLSDLWRFDVEAPAPDAITQSWVQRFNGVNNLEATPRALAVTASGDVVIAGVTERADNIDLYVAKYGATTGSLLWERYYDGTGHNWDSAEFVAVNNAGDVFVAGASVGNGTGYDYYVAKYASANGSVLWERRYTGTSDYNDFPHGLAVDSAGNVVVTGESASPGQIEFYTAKYSGATGATLWQQRTQGQPGALALDTAGNVYVVGERNPQGARELYAVKYAAATGAVLWGKQTDLLGKYNSTLQDIHGAAVDPSGNLAVAVRTSSFETRSDFYTVKFAAGDGALLWEQRFFTAADDYPQAIGVDGAGNVFVCGYTEKAAFSYDYYTVKYSASTGTVLWSKTFSQTGNSTDQAYHLAVDPAGNVIVTGESTGLTLSNIITLKYAGSDGTVMWQQTYNGPANAKDSGKHVAADGIGAVVVLGSSESASGNLDFATIKYAPPAGPPTLGTLVPLNVTRTSATLRGVVSSNSNATSLYFERADQPNEQAWLAAQPSSAPAGETNAAFSVVLSGLMPHTSYTCRAVGKNSAGTAFGNSVTFTTPNTPPAVTDDVYHSASADEWTFDPRVNDSDLDGDALSITAVTQPEHGNATITTTGIRYVPAADFLGNDSFSYTVSDGFGGTATGTITLVNAAPVAGTIRKHPDFGPGGTASIPAEGFISDPDGDVLRIVDVTPGEHGAVRFEGNTLIYGPADAGFSGSDSFTYTVSDGAGKRATATVIFANALPQVENLTAHPGFGPGETKLIDVSSQVADKDSDGLSIVNVSQGTHGTVSFSGLTITYSAAATFKGNDSFSYTVSDGRGGIATATITFRNDLPIANNDLLITNGGPETIDPRQNDPDLDNDSLVITSVTQGSFGSAAVINGTVITYTPGPLFFGRDSFTYTVSDGSASATATVTVRSSEPIALAGPEKGEQVPGQAEGVVYATLGKTTDAVFSGSIQQGTGKPRRAIFGPDGSVRLKVGDPAPGFDGATISAFGEPCGQAVLATLAGSGITSATNTVLYVGLADGSVRLAVREGDELPGGGKLKKFLKIDGNGATVFLIAQLAGPSVKPANDVALLAVTPGGELSVLARKGDLIDGKPIIKLETLVGVSGTLAEGRWRSGEEAIGVRVTFPAKQQALYTIPATASAPETWTRWASTGDIMPESGKLMRLGLPGYGPDGVTYAVQLAAVPGTVVTRGTDTLLIRATEEGSWQLAREGDPVPASDGTLTSEVRFKTFGDPIAGANGRTAFSATVDGAGVNKRNRDGLWMDNGDRKLRLLARAGDLAPGGGKWQTFESLVFPDGPQSGSIFTARLVIAKDEGVTAQNNRGLWGIDSAGELRLLLRTGQIMDFSGIGRIIKSFVALTPESTAAGTASGYDDDRHITALVTFTDRTQTIVRIAVP